MATPNVVTNYNAPGRDGGPALLRPPAERFTGERCAIAHKRER